VKNGIGKSKLGVYLSEISQITANKLNHEVVDEQTSSAENGC
jgi:hypothetical protein